MTVRVLLFGHYREAAPPGSGDHASFLLPVQPGVTIADVAALLASRDPRFSDLLSRTRFAVGAEFVPPHTVLHDGDEVAFLPPMSGG